MNTYPFQPAELMAVRQWHHTIDLNSEVIFVSPHQALSSIVLHNSEQIIPHRGGLLLLRSDADVGGFLFRHHGSRLRGDAQMPLIRPCRHDQGQPPIVFVPP